MAVAQPGSLGTATIRVIANTTEFDYRLRRSLRNLSIAAAGVGAAMAGVNFLGNSLKEATKLESVMARIKTIMDEPAKDTAFLNTDKFRALSNELGISAQEIAEASYLALSSGTAVEDVMDVIAASAKTALTTNSTVTEAVNATTSALNAYAKTGLTAKQSNDILFRSLQFGKGTMREFSRYISNAIPIASQLGVEFSQLSALGAASTLTGKTARVAFTGLKVAMQELADETKGGGKAFKEVFGESFQDYIERTGDLAGALVRFGKQVGGKNLTNIFGAKEGAAAIQQILAIPEERLKVILSETAAAAGTVDKAWGEVENTYARQAARLKEQWTNLKSELGESLLPVATEVLRQTQGILEKARPAFRNFRDFIRTTFTSDDVGVWVSAISTWWEENLKPTLEEAVTAAQEAWPYVSEALVEVAEAVKDLGAALSPVLQPLATLVIELSKIALITGAVVLEQLADLVKTLSDNLVILGITIGILTAAAGAQAFATLVLASGGLAGAFSFLAFVVRYHVVLALDAFIAKMAATRIGMMLTGASATTMWALITGPVGAVVLAIGAIVTGFVILWQRSETFRRFWEDMWLSIKAIAYAGLDALTDIFIGIAQGATLMFKLVLAGWAKLPGIFGGGKARDSLAEVNSLLSDLQAIRNKTEEMAVSARNAADDFNFLNRSAVSAGKNVFMAGAMADPNAIQGPGTYGVDAQRLKSIREEAEALAWFPTYEAPKSGSSPNLSTKGLGQMTDESKKAAKKAAESAAKAALKQAATTFKKLVRNLGEQTYDAIDQSFDTLYQQLREAGKTKLIDRLKKFEKDILAMAKKRDKLHEAWDIENRKLQDLKDSAKALKDSLRDAAREMGNVTKNNSFHELLGPDFTKIVANLENAVMQTSRFTQVFQQLKAMGLNKTTLRQLLDAGIIEGLGAGEAILAAGTDGVAQVNDLQTQLNKAGEALAKTGYDTFYKQGIAIAQGVVDGLAAQEDKLIAQMTKLGKKMSDSFKKELGIKSPSKVFEENGANIVAGLAKGITGAESMVSSSMAGLNGSLNSVIPSQGGAGDVHVYIDGQEFKGMIRTEIRDRDRTRKNRAQAGSRSGTLNGK